MKETNQEAAALLSLTDESVVRLLAEHEEILRLVEQSFPVKVFARGSSLSIKGEDDQLVKKLEDLLVQYAGPDNPFAIPVAAIIGRAAVYPR